MTATKAQEMEALKKISGIIASLGENSYVAAAFAGCEELAKENIRWDELESMQEMVKRAEVEVTKLRADHSRHQATIMQLEIQIERLKVDIEKEQEWKDREESKVTTMSTADYEKLVDAHSSRVMTPKEAADTVERWFGFNHSRVEILNRAPLYQVSRHGQVRKYSTIDRSPIYVATDWCYIRFRCSDVVYEVVNGDLFMVED